MVTDTHFTHHVLIVEDDAVTRARIAAYFETENYRVSQSEDGDDVHRLIAESAIDVVLLDINLPGKDGLQIARELSEKTDIGIILVTARNDEIDRIVGLEIGADDYVTKPFNPRELLARVKNLIRRKQSDQSKHRKQRSKSFSGWTLDLSRRCLSSNNRENRSLTRGEFELLVTFLEHPGKTLHREWLMEKVTHRVWSPNERTIDVLVLRLRNKIEEDGHAPQIILTVHGEGYLFASEVF
jgi:two-component system torCAD operon response regulator TorR